MYLLKMLFWYVLKCGLFHIRSVLIGNEYRNCCRTLDVNFDIQRQLEHFEYEMIHALNKT